MCYRTQKTTDSQIFSINKPSASTDNFHEQKLTQNIKNENNRKTECIDLIKQLNKDISPKEFGNQTLSILSQHYNITQGILYKAQEPYLSILSTFAYHEDENKSFEFGQGLAGQVAKAQRIVNIQSIPAGYIKIISGLGESTPTNLLVCPLIVDGKTIGVLEVAAFEEFSKEDENNFEIIASELTNILHTANG